MKMADAVSDYGDKKFSSEKKRLKNLGVRDRRRSSKELLVDVCVTGKFEYGVFSPASHRNVHIFMRRAENVLDMNMPKPRYWGCHKTNRKGKLTVQTPISSVPGIFYCIFKLFKLFKKGHYHVLALLPEDNTYGRGSLFVLEKGTQFVVFDLDGTITTSDVHVVAQTLLDSASMSTVIGSSLGKNYDLKARPNALTAVRAWAAKGYQVFN